MISKNIHELVFAFAYDYLDMIVADFVKEYRVLTAGMVSGRVLEIGAGTGANLSFYPLNISLTLLDKNPFMVKKLVKKTQPFDVDVEIILDNAENLPFPNNSFDSVVVTLVLCMVDDVNSILDEIYRVLKPGGKFYFYEHIRSSHQIRSKVENCLNPIWRCMSTGCNLNRNTNEMIMNHKFSDSKIKTTDLQLWVPWLSIKNIVGFATV